MLPSPAAIGRAWDCERSRSWGAASRLAPFSYSQLIWVAIIGFLAFGDFPDGWSLCGIAILIASGVFIATRQRRLARRMIEAGADAVVGGHPHVTQGADLVGEARLIDAMVPRGAAILDAGCGPGRHAGHLHERGA